MNILPQREKAAAAPRIVSVNGTVIPSSAIIREIQYHPAASPTESWQRAAEALVLRALLLEEADRQGVAAEALVDDRGRRETQDEAAIRALIEQAVRIPTPTDDELRRYYDANAAKFRAPELFEARHILISARVDSALEYEAARTKAETLAVMLDAAPHRFEELAHSHSDCASSGEGGYLGQLSAEEVTPEFAAAVAGMRDRETTTMPVETRYGFHLVRLERRIPARTLPFEEVVERIAEYLTERSRRTATAQYIARLVSRAEITGVTMTGADVQRVH